MGELGWFVRYVQPDLDGNIKDLSVVMGSKQATNCHNLSPNWSRDSPGRLIPSQSLQHFALNTERKLLIVGWYEHRAIIIQ